MGMFEEKHIDPLIKQKVKLYVRYIDDIFFIWKGSKNEIQQFISKINEVHPSIKVDFNYSKAQIHFCDITTTRASTGKISKTLYRKEINRQSYSYRKSQHLQTLNL